MKLLEESSFLGDEQWPPGFRFHPTDEELVLYYLKRKIRRRRIKLDVIGEVDVYKCDPEELPGLSQLKSGDRQWFFFSPRDRKYPNGGRANRATRLGYWKATGKDRNITCNSRSVGIKKTLVFYKGRAPSGVRTDWVMHEYTLDEEELKRCPEAHDYYALYKLFKKSGPGPKNGEQYGAPFREEDWADDDKVADVANTEEFTSEKQDRGHAPFDSTGTNFQAHSQINILEELMNQNGNDHLFEPDAVVCNTVLTDKEAPGTLMNKSLLEANVQDAAIVVPQSWQQDNFDASFDPIHSVTSLFQGTSEIASVPSMSRLGSHESEEDFLEINDLAGPDSFPQNIENPVDGLRFEDFDGLCELDVFQDAPMFLQEVGATEPVSNIYINNVESEIHNPVPNLYATDFEYGVVGDDLSVCFSNFRTEMSQAISHPHHQNLDNEMGSQCSHQLQCNPDVASQHWVHEQNSNVAIQAESSQESILPPASDVVYAGVNQNQSPTQNQSDKDNEVVNSWFSSTLWSFVESIPTTSASAAESTALVNKAFERLSSFGRRGSSVKVSSVNDTMASSGNTLSARGRSRNRYSSRGLLLLSIVGVLCAILWMMMRPGRCFP